MLHAAGVSMKVVSDILGHANESFTADVYAVVAEELAEDAAVKLANFVPHTVSAKWSHNDGDAELSA
ncbi:hypothetical protein [Spirillospora albida]|uniref:hypothetical protein n=1 Tax=Spirillospora albida TaxID=58123 RepID=UPI001B807E94|nr:hypothetical protein [Spirillospora albida]